MTLELDHIFVCTSVAAPEANDLLKLGLTEGDPTSHPGQGTANRRFFFHNAMLELLFVTERQEAQSEIARPTFLWERWLRQSDTICPFGLCFRPSDPSVTVPPFSAWEYRPPYLPPPLAIHVANSAPILTEPMLFYLAFGCRPDIVSSSRRQPLQHALGLREITGVHWVRPQAAPISQELATVVGAGTLSVSEGEAHALEIQFDGALKGQSADLRPALSIVLHW